MKKVISLALSLMLILSVGMTVSAQEDITADTVTFQLNNKTVDLTNADAKNSGTSHATLQIGQYFEYTVNTETEGNYMLTFTCGTNGVQYTLAKMDIFVNGTLVLDDAYMEDTKAYGTRLPHELGVITLTPGANVIRFQAIGGAVVSTQFSLTKRVEIPEDITQNPMVFPLNTTTVEDYSNASAEHSSENYITLFKTNYVEYTVSTKKRERYTLSVNSGGEQDGVLLDVSVNGETQISGGAYKNTGDYQNWADQYLGTITLEEGSNVLRFTVPAASTDAAVIRSFMLTKYEEPDVYLSTAEATRLEAEDYTTENVKSHTAASGGKWVDNTWADSVNPIYMYIGLEESGYYDLDYVMLHCTGASLSVVTIYIDGKNVGDNT